jgi:hypothetical protein
MEFEPTACVELISPAQLRRQRAAEAASLFRADMLPHLARLMMDRLVRVLLAQRTQLLETQEISTDRVTELEQRLNRLQEQLQLRFETYQLRIVALERELAAKEEENRELLRTNFQLAKKALEAEAAAKEGDTANNGSTDAGFLLRA